MDNGKKVNSGIAYKNQKYRPNVFFDKILQLEIEEHFKTKGYSSFNQYVNDLVKKDMENN